MRDERVDAHDRHADHSHIGGYCMPIKKEPLALNPVLRGVDLAMERLLLFYALSPEAESCLNALRYELATAVHDG